MKNVICMYCPFKIVVNIECQKAKQESLENLSNFLEVLFRIKRYDTDT